MYINSQSRGLGVLPVAAAVSVTHAITSIFKGGVEYHPTSASQIEWFGKAFGMLPYAYRGTNFKEKSWFDQELKRGQADVDSILRVMYDNLNRPLELASIPLGQNKKSGTPPTDIPSIPPGSYTPTVGPNANTNWPSSSTSLTTAKTTEAQIEQASAFPIVPMLIAGGVLFLLAGNIKKALKRM